MAIDKKILQQSEVYDLGRKRFLLLCVGGTISMFAFLLFIIIIHAVIAGASASKIYDNRNYLLIITSVGLIPLLMSFSVLLAWNNKIQSAAWLFSLAGGIISQSSSLFSAFTGNFDSSISLLYIAGSIILVSVVGTPMMILFTAFSASVVTIIAIDFAPRSALFAQYLQITGPTLIEVTLIFYWGIALLFVLQNISYSKTLRDLTAAKGEIEQVHKMDELKDQFIRSVNHELRTPIMGLLGYIDIMRMPQSRNNLSALQNLADHAQNVGISLRELLNSIMDTRRLDVESMKVNIQPVNVHECLHSAIEVFSGAEAVRIHSDLRVYFEDTLAVYADYISLHQVLINLLSNALKYSPAGALIEISARAVPQKSNALHPEFIELAIKDHGLGVPVDQASLLFQKFVRLPRDLESNVMGTGLGLYLCKSLIEKMKGSIRLESIGIPGSGSTFIVTLPKAPWTIDQTIAKLATVDSHTITAKRVH